MKKLLLLLISFSLIIFSVGCNVQDDKDTATTTTTAAATPPTSAGAGYDPNNCRETDKLKGIRLSLENELSSLSLAIPEDWALQNHQGGYLISFGEETIGHIRLHDDSVPFNGEEVFSYNEFFESVNIFSSIIRYTVEDSFYHTRRLVLSYEYEYVFMSFEMEIVYEQLGDNTLASMLDCVKISDKYRPSPVADLAMENSSRQIAILGNSFVNSSSIGAILTNMLSQTHPDYSVFASSIGYANVTTYVGNAAIMNSIRNGDFGMVLLCGFYSQAAVDGVEDIVEACELSNTKLVFFPAHNENATYIENAVATYNGIEILNWKNEIDILINDGIDYWDFCYDDSHKHSTALAGYVGAHMIYRTLFDDFPPMLEEDTPINEGDYEKIVQSLGEYAMPIYVFN